MYHTTCMNMNILLPLMGGLGFFLFGMRNMSEGIEKAAGARLRRILERLTTNTFTGIIVGAAFTALIQSSSACTAMVVSFVNAGLMTLNQAAGIIFGANIGTTITALLVSFKLEKAAPVILLTGVVLMIGSQKNSFLNKLGEVITGFGTLFMGLSMMSDAMAGMKDSPAVISIFSSLNNPLLATLIGLVITAVVQSSSVTVSIMVLLANQGLIGLDMIIYTILGCNIGACMTAILASHGGHKDAKRTAAIHFLFNFLGSAVIYVLLLLFGDRIVAGLEKAALGDAGRAVAYAHMGIKIFQVILFTPFINQIVKLTYVLVPGDDSRVGYRDEYKLKYIGDKVVFNPATAVIEVIKEIDRMASLANENLNRAMNALITLDEEDIAEVYEVENNIDFLNDAITNYLVRINKLPLPIDDLTSIGALFHVVNDIERIGDHAKDIADFAQQRKDTGSEFSKVAISELGQMMEQVNKVLQYATVTFVEGTDEYVDEIEKIEDKLDDMDREFQMHHIQRLSRGECTPEAGMIFSDVISGLERVGDHAVNIAFAISEAEAATA